MRPTFSTSVWATVLVLAAALIALLAYGLVARSSDTSIQDRLAAGRPTAAPPFDLEILDRGRIPDGLGPSVTDALGDGRLALDELRGTPVVLNFWASWCTPCAAEAPVLERGWRAASRRGVLFLGLNTQDARSDARGFLARYDVTYPNVREADRLTARRYGGTGLPETYFIDATGRVVGKVIGAISQEQLASGIDAARAGAVAALGSGGDRRTQP